MKKIKLYKGQCEWVENIEKVLGISSSAIFTIKLKFKGQNYKGTYEAIYGGRDFTHLFFFYHSKSLNKTCKLAVSPVDICCESVVLMKNGNKIPKADLISLNMRPSKNLNIGYSYVIESGLLAGKARHCIYTSYDEQGYNFLFYDTDTGHIACFKIGYNNIDNYEVYSLEDDVPAEVDLKDCHS